MGHTRTHAAAGLVVAATLALGCVAVQAAPLVFVESTDLSNTNTGGPTIGTLDLGLNTVSGSISALPPPDRLSSDYADFWEVDVSPGQQITGIDIVLTGVSGPLRAFASDVVIGGGGTATVAAFTQQFTSGAYALTTTPAGLFRTGAYPFPSGHYYFGTLALFSSAPTNYSYEWRITVTRAAVAEPAAVALAALGVLGVAFARTRRAR